MRPVSRGLPRARWSTTRRTAGSFRTTPRSPNGSPTFATAEANRRSDEPKRGCFVLLLATGRRRLADRQAAAARSQDGAQRRQTDAAQEETEAAQRRPSRQRRKRHRRQTEEAQAQTEEDAKLTSAPGGKALGMSILGNQEAPKALVIVPWKSSELGNSLGISTMLDDSRQPIDKEVFMRVLQLLRDQVGNGAPRRCARPTANATQRRHCGAQEEVMSFDGVAGKRRPIRRRGDGLPRRALRLFGGADRGQAPPLPRGLRASRRSSSPCSRSSCTGESSRS